MRRFASGWPALAFLPLVFAATTPIGPCLHFPGTRREAAAFYQQCLGGDPVSSFASLPGADQLPAAARSGVAHASLVNGAHLAGL